MNDVVDGILCKKRSITQACEGCFEDLDTLRIGHNTNINQVKARRVQQRTKYCSSSTANGSILLCTSLAHLEFILSNVGYGDKLTAVTAFTTCTAF